MHINHHTSHAKKQPKKKETPAKQQSNQHKSTHAKTSHKKTASKHHSAQASISQGNMNALNTGGLYQSLQAIEQTADGAKLIAAAKHDNVSLKVGQLANIGGDDVQGDYNSANNTITISDPSNIMVLTHEMVHAVTPADGDSDQEEGVANVIGAEVAAQVAGQPTPDLRGIFTSTVQLYQTALPSLPVSSSIVSDLAQLGITVPTDTSLNFLG